jgi:hypothetical protein
VEVDLSSVSDELVKMPTYRVMDRKMWIGTKHTKLYGWIKAMIELWNPVWTVIDATGIGAGLASFLASAYPDKVIPFIFSGTTKSKLGWDFLAVIETGRFKDWLLGKRSSFAQPEERETFYQELSYCQMEIVPGPERKMKWGVPDGTRDTSNGELVHDDLILSAALCAVLDEQEWSISTAPLIVRKADPLEEMDREGF